MEPDRERLELAMAYAGAKMKDELVGGIKYLSLAVGIASPLAMLSFDEKYRMVFIASAIASLALAGVAHLTQKYYTRPALERQVDRMDAYVIKNTFG